MVSYGVKCPMQWGMWGHVDDPCGVEGNIVNHRVVARGYITEPANDLVLGGYVGYGVVIVYRVIVFFFWEDRFSCVGANFFPFYWGGVGSVDV